MNLIIIFWSVLISLIKINHVESKSSYHILEDESGGEDHRCRSEITGKDFNLILPENYNKLEIPIGKKGSPGNGVAEPETLKIVVGVLIRKIRDVDGIEENVSVEMDFITTWTDILIFEANQHLFENLSLTDEILEKSLKTLDAAFLGRIWKPDLFIEHAVYIARPHLISRPIKLNFSPIGTIIYSTRVTLKMDCDMEFHFYPADTQYCMFKIRSYSHTIKELKMDWMDPVGAFVFDRSDTNFDMKISDVIISNTTEFHGLLYEEYSETYDVLQFTLLFRRRMSYHLIQTYLPTVFFIGITWLCFLVPEPMVEIRVGVPMTTLLTLTSMFSSIRESTPIVSYVKAIDIWMVVCIFFVFATLFEFAILIWLRHLEKTDPEPEYERQKTVDEEQNSTGPLETFTETLRARYKPRKTARSDKKFQNAAILIEAYGFRALFISFLFFNISYWPWLLVQSNYFDWDVDYKYNVRD